MRKSSTDVVRVKRDTEEDPKSYNTTKSQDADVESKVSTNPDASDSGSC